MKFLVTWKVPEDEWLDILDGHSSMTTEERGEAGEGVSFVGRWYDLAERSGVALIEAEDIAAVFAYLAHGNGHVETTVWPVLED